MAQHHTEEARVANDLKKMEPIVERLGDALAALFAKRSRGARDDPASYRHAQELIGLFYSAMEIVRHETREHSDVVPFGPVASVVDLPERRRRH
jgi:hypothetical protein